MSIFQQGEGFSSIKTNYYLGDNNISVLEFIENFCKPNTILQTNILVKTN